MARILVLGPSAWRATYHDAPTQDPIVVRTRLCERLRRHEHEAMILEELSGPDKPLRRKFIAALGAADDIILYWPPNAKMVTTQQELAIIPGINPVPRLWILAHQDVATLDGGFMELTEHGDRGRYTDDILDVTYAFIPWRTEPELFRLADLVAESIHALAGER